MTKPNQVQKITEKAVDTVVSKIKALEGDGAISFPDKYSYANALKSAYLLLEQTTDKNGNSVLETCTKTSIVNTLFDMAIQGLSVAKKQCYFIPYGNELTLSRSYFGTMAVTKRIASVDIKPQVIYENDEFEMEIDVIAGAKKITKHIQKFESLGTKIKGAYCIITYPNGNTDVEVMNRDQIETAWNMRKGQGLSPAHKNFPDRMAMKTVIQRACAYVLNTSDDSDLVVGAMNRSDESEMDYSEENEIKKEISQNANSKKIKKNDVIDAETTEVKEDPKPDENGELPMTEDEKRDAEQEEMAESSLGLEKEDEGLGF